jgi:hypothetical protein
MSGPNEKCQNPWKSDCASTSIEVYIVYEKRQLPICTQCWRRIASDDNQWEG